MNELTKEQLEKCREGFEASEKINDEATGIEGHNFCLRYLNEETHMTKYMRAAGYLAAHKDQQKRIDELKAENNTLKGLFGKRTIELAERAEKAERLLECARDELNYYTQGRADEILSQAIKQAEEGK